MPFNPLNIKSRSSKQIARYLTTGAAAVVLLFLHLPFRCPLCWFQRTKRCIERRPWIFSKPYSHAGWKTMMLQFHKHKPSPELSCQQLCVHVNMRNASSNVQAAEPHTSRTHIQAMLVWYIGECMASIININIGIKESTGGYENCSSTQIFIFGGYFKVRGSF